MGMKRGPRWTRRLQHQLREAGFTLIPTNHHAKVIDAETGQLVTVMACTPTDQTVAIQRTLRAARNHRARQERRACR